MTEHSVPPSVRIADELRRQISSGRLAPGARMPSTRALVQRYGVAMATATKVLTSLRHEGLIRSVPGVGTVVVGGPSRTGPAARPDDGAEPTAGWVSTRSWPPASRWPTPRAWTALSMRRVAAELGGAPMSLYRHVSRQGRAAAQDDGRGDLRGRAPRAAGGLARRARGRGTGTVGGLPPPPVAALGPVADPARSCSPGHWSTASGCSASCAGPSSTR